MASDNTSSESWMISASDLRARFLGGERNKPLSDLDAGNNVSVLSSIEAQIKRGSPVKFGTFAAVWDALKNSNTIGIDDRKMLLEDVIVFMSRLPPNTQLGAQVEHFMIEFLYKDLHHPPATFLAPLPPMSEMSAKFVSSPRPQGFAWREADGSNNNLLIPQLGAAHTAYARSVTATRPMFRQSLPDPAVVFDTLLKRTKKVDHPTGLSSCFFAFANLIIHTLFNTNRRDPSINDTSSYLDLSPLYGVDMAEQQTIRQFDGTGRIFEDTFADIRMLGMPPAVAGLLLVFNRNHNYIADRILHINEFGTYSSDPLPSDPKKLRDQDDEIFNRARSVNSGAFMQVIMHDYVGNILGMIPDLNPFYLEALEEIRDSSHSILPRGEGNACSVEFNLLYRWHATTSESEEKWLEESWNRLFPNKGYDEITPEEFGRAVGMELLSQGRDPRKWTFGGLKRDPVTNRFSDKDVAQILHSATDDLAQGFRARGIPAVFKVIEIMGIQQARAWNVCSLNEFRKFLGLKPYTNFREWNRDEEISAAAEKLYHDIDNLELFVGMQAEEVRPSRPGSGLCSGYTMSRSILADAIALIRGDRFLTTDFSPQNLTTWGYQDVQTTPDNGSLGGMLTKLLYRAFPNDYRPGSIYAHFPFTVPSRMRQFMEKDSRMIKEYNWNKPQSVSPIIPVAGVATIQDILSNTSAFSSPYESNMARLTNGYGFFYGGAESSKNLKMKDLIRDILFTPTANTSHGEYFYNETLELLADKSYSTGPTTRTVDVVREVINCVSVHWAAAHVVNLSIRTSDNSPGKYSVYDLHYYLAVVFSYVYLNNRPASAWFLEQTSRRVAKELLAEISSLSGEVEKVAGTLHKTMDKLTKRFKQHDHDAEHTKSAFNELKRMFKSTPEELSYNIFGILINCVANWSHSMVHVVDFYLDPSRKKERDVISNLASSSRFSDLEEAQFRGYVREALRLDPAVSGVLREARTATTTQGLQLGGGDRVYLNLAGAYKDDGAFLEPNNVDPQRRLTDKAPSLSVPGAHSSLNEEFSEKTMAQTLRAIFRKSNLRRGPGASGRLSRFTEEMFGTRQTLYSDVKGQATMWPQTMILQYEIPQI